MSKRWCALKEDAYLSYVNCECWLYKAHTDWCQKKGDLLAVFRQHTFRCWFLWQKQEVWFKDAFKKLSQANDVLKHSKEKSDKF